ncbi:Cellular retinoic acid-binding protein 2 [Halocaridina rubra]|uniref:Cellular retinoic acid-binding protein 2 n=1 Tax=Halocaridina rubra TaxID=373956 RepID=A0AAN9A1V0_HALRR
MERAGVRKDNLSLETHLEELRYINIVPPEALIVVIQLALGGSCRKYSRFQLCSSITIQNYIQTKLSMELQFDGTYLHEKDENFETLLAKLGANYIMRKVASKAKPTIKVKIEGDSWTLTTILLVKTITWQFRLNEKVEIYTPDGNIKVIFSLNGKTLTQTPTGEPSERDTVVVREFTEDGMKQTMTHVSSGTVGIRYFKKTKE